MDEPPSRRGNAGTVRACDSCRRRKRKCAWTDGASKCTPCNQYKEDCKTTHVRKQRTKGLKRRQRISEYEVRIHRLESLLEERSAAQPSTIEKPLPPLADTAKPLKDLVGDLRTEIGALPYEEGFPDLPFDEADELDELERNGFEDLSYLPTPTTTVAVPPCPGGPGFYGVSMVDNVDVTSSGGQDSIFADVQVPSVAQEPDIFASTQQQPDLGSFLALRRAQCVGYLPPPEEGTSLLSEFLVDFNGGIPLYRPHDLTKHLRICYTGTTDDGRTVSWANVYVVFAIAHRLRAMSAAATPRDSIQAEMYLSWVLNSVQDLLLSPPSLPLIQCLIGLGWLLQSSAHSQPYGIFVSTALRMANCFNSTENTCPAADEVDYEQQRRVFWIAFAMETEMCLLYNQPTMHRPEHILTSRPEDDPEDAAGAINAAEGSWSVNVFALRIQLAVLQAEVIDLSMSMKARNKTRGEIETKAKQILENLKNWRKHELFQLTAEQLMHLLYRSDIVHVTALEAAYFSTIFRLYISLESQHARVEPFSAETLTNATNYSVRPCYGDARRFLAILSVAPQGDIAISWIIKRPVIAALAVVLLHVVGNPFLDPPSEIEIGEYRKIYKVLRTLIQKSQDTELAKMARVCTALYCKVVELLGVETPTEVV